MLKKLSCESKQKYNRYMSYSWTPSEINSVKTCELYWNLYRIDSDIYFCRFRRAKTIKTTWTHEPSYFNCIVSSTETEKRVTYAVAAIIVVVSFSCVWLDQLWYLRVFRSIALFKAHNCIKTELLISSITSEIVFFITQTQIFISGSGSNFRRRRKVTRASVFYLMCSY